VLDYQDEGGVLTKIAAAPREAAAALARSDAVAGLRPPPLAK